MMGCRKAQRLLATALYEPLDEKARASVEAHVARCAACRSDWVALRGLVEAIPRQRPTLDVDLASRARARLDAEPVSTPRRRRWVSAVPAMAASALLVALAAYIAWPGLDKGPSDDKTPPLSAQSQIGAALDRAAALTAEGRYEEAFFTLKSAVEAHPEDPLAGEAYARLADVAYTYLYRWRDADQAYETLVNDYADAYNESPNHAEIFSRRNLLAEARRLGRDYPSLTALAAARESRGDRFADLEDVITQYPGTLVATLACADMCALVAQEGEVDDARPQVAAMRVARDRCASPIAINQFDLELAQTYLDAHDIDSARDHYQRAAESEVLSIANRARTALARLER